MPLLWSLGCNGLSVQSLLVGKMLVHWESTASLGLTTQAGASQNEARWSFDVDLIPGVDVQSKREPTAR